MASIPIGTSVENPNLNLSTEPIHHEPKLTVIQLQAYEDAIYIKKPISLLKYEAIAIMALAVFYPWFNYMLWPTILVHIFIVPAHIAEAVFVLRSTEESIKYTKYKINRLVALCLGAACEAWIFTYIILTSVLCKWKHARMAMFIIIMASIHLVLNLLMSLEHYFLFSKNTNHSVEDKIPEKNAI